MLMRPQLFYSNGYILISKTPNKRVLTQQWQPYLPPIKTQHNPAPQPCLRGAGILIRVAAHNGSHQLPHLQHRSRPLMRSEERRVGKECKAGGWVVNEDKTQQE